MIMRPGQIDSIEQKNASITHPQQAGFYYLTRPGLFLSLILGGFVFSGCAQMLGFKPLIEVPQRSEREVVASKEVSDKAITTLGTNETNKVNKMQELAKDVTKARVTSIERITRAAIAKTEGNPNAVANIVENAFIALNDTTIEFLRVLKDVDGTKGYVAGLTERYIKVGEISDIVQLASLAGQTTVAAAMVPEAKKQFSAFARWTFNDLFPYIIGISVPVGGGLIAMGWKLISFFRRRKEDDEALEATIEGNQELMNKYGKTKVDESGKTLWDVFKAIMGSKHSGVRKNMKAVVEKVRKERKLEPK